MRVWSGETVATLLGTEGVSPINFTEISTDSRTVKPMGLFVALSGEHFDGHEFLSAVRDKGALGAVVKRGTNPVDGLQLFEVDDTLIALGVLANARRKEIRGPVVAVTGSNGKTTTKEMLARVLGTRWRTHCTHANLNNLIGVPLTILAAPPETQALVVEAGASEPGEIPRLRDIIEPTVAVVTNVSASHLSGFKSLDTLLAEKASLVVGAELAVVGANPAQLKHAVSGLTHNTVSAGLEETSDMRPERWTTREDGGVDLEFGGHTFTIPLPGRHQGDNAMLALAVARELGVPLAGAAQALANLPVQGGRGEILRFGDMVVLNDTYNANPASLAAALDTAADMRGTKPLVVVVGSMLELGDDSTRFHEEAARKVLDAGPSLVGAYGEFVPAFQALDFAKPEIVIAASDVETLGRALRQRMQGDEFVVLKASRGMQLEGILPWLALENKA